MDMTELDDFRLEVRDWLQTNCPPEMRLPVIEEERCWGGKKWKFHSTAQRDWLNRTVARGWTAPTWPKEYGGAGLTHEQAKILREEMDALHCRAPLERIGQGLGLLGPTLLKIGTEQQKAQHLAPIARGEVRWCQGYSEPNAGSDLASLQMRAEDYGDHFLVNGQKTWTSHADKSDWIFVLVRTDPKAPKHLGISFLLIDMTSPGIEARPFPLISGKSSFCDTFFENVKVPKENLVGPLNGGWDVSKFLLSHERGSIATTRSFTSDESLGVRAKRWIRETDGRLSDPALRDEIAAYEVDLWSFAAAVARVGDLNALDQGGIGWASVLKLAFSEANQRRMELLMAAGGSELLEWESERTSHGEEPRTWLRSKANSIEGGTSEIQLNILAKRVLNLPGA
ncbi:acyl-CoA dehydrogenase family protein [Paraburkholderia graminis]|uniref:acyl-CoA dehydrogenase family protein n=2 Tax=Paraburkholderia graminis TaxID=60548 RepID=UPI0038BBAC80